MVVCNILKIGMAMDELFADHAKLGKLQGKIRKLCLSLMTSPWHDIKGCINLIGIRKLMFQMMGD
jgi:hypothetical protein